MCSLPENVYSGYELRFLIHLHVRISSCPQLLLSLIQFLVHSSDFRVSCVKH